MITCIGEWFEIRFLFSVDQIALGEFLVLIRGVVDCSLFYVLSSVEQLELHFQGGSLVKLVI